ncbi:hypothetical protein WICPIJ_003678 [Wickerhamomyces pijperi]|uniref:Uncharacterized protein n=1 Tax=Wickerhamomyces pijperi TaxID=599730 RepID=A0A9P8TP02_WICPI|nr:hypothetical protein WICPIJ_003678 [Wickerhamomyces pijperi]
MGPGVTLHDQLMGSGNERETVRMVELLRDILTEGETGTTWRDTPATSVVRIGPQQVTHWAFVWDLLDSVQFSDLVDGFNHWRQPTMKTEDLVVHQGGDREVVE